nr:MAG TPA: hypothetical protein [Caudoviricetes sp.]
MVGLATDYHFMHNPDRHTTQKDTTMELPKMQDPYLTEVDIPKVLSLPVAVARYLDVLRAGNTSQETVKAFWHLAAEEHDVTETLERLYIKYLGNPPEFLWEYPEAEQARWILELSPSPLPLSQGLREAESLLVIAGQIRTFLDRVGVPRMTGVFKEQVGAYLLDTPIRDLRENTLGVLYKAVWLDFVEVADDGTGEFTCVIPTLYAVLQDGGENTSEYVDVDALKERNYELLCKARNLVMPEWDEVYGDA